jgi:hypothetical protein
MKAFSAHCGKNYFGVSMSETIRLLIASHSLALHAGKEII